MLNDHRARLLYTGSLLRRAVMEQTPERISMISEIVLMIEQDIVRHARACELEHFAQAVERGGHRPRQAAQR